MNDILYHGTSQANWDMIRAEGAMKPAPIGHQHVSLTTDPQVARYFANIAVGIQEDVIETHPIILTVSREDLEAAGLPHEPFADGIWGENECDWEAEFAVHGEIPAALFRVLDMTGLERALSREEIIGRRVEDDAPSP